MEVVYSHCAGLDVHKSLIVACVLTPKGKQIRTFGALTGELLEMAHWLEQEQVTHVAMESAGVYWKPVWNLLEELGFHQLLVNARHMKAVPGRKTDVKDAEWIASLLKHGLLKASFVPPREQRELRELVRYRRAVIEQCTQVRLRIHKVLEGANIKLASVISDVLGKTGRGILKAMIKGVSNVQKLSKLAKGSLQAHRDRLEPALVGRMGSHQKVVLASLLDHLEFMEAQIEKLDAEVAERLKPFDELIDRIDAIPGMGRRNAEEILAEIGTDMSRFASPGHLASWARLCPGNNESGGKRSPTSIGPGNRWLRSALVEAGWASSRTKNSYLRAQYYRIKARRGGKRAVIALAHSILLMVYHLIQSGETYQDLGVDYFDRRAKEKVVKQAVKRIEKLGYRVELQAPPPLPDLTG